MKSFFVSMMLSFIYLAAFSQQTTTVEGRVMDTQGQALPYANVQIAKLSIGSVGDENGYFKLEKVPFGTHIIEVSSLGYTEQSRSIVIGKGPIKNLDFRLIEDTENLEEVVVQGKSDARKLQESAQAVTVVTTETVKLQSVDLGEIMANTEGVSVQRAGGLGSNARFALNGLSGDQVRFFYDGIPLNFSPFAFGIANVPVNAIDRVEVYKGVVPIQFGADALGGAVNLVPPPINNKFGGSISYQTGSFGTHRITTNLEHYNENSGFFSSLGAFYDYTDNDFKIDVAVPNERGQLRQETVERFHDAYRAYGINTKLGLRNKKWAKELSVEGYYGDYDNEIQNSQSPGLINLPQLGISEAIGGRPFGEVTFSSYSAGVNLHYNISPSKKWKIDLKTGYNYEERESFDVSQNIYDWFGEVIGIQNQPGEFGPADNLITKSENVFARQQTIFEINDRHSLNLSLAPTYGLRTADNLLIDGPSDPALGEGRLFDFVSGLEYRAELFNRKLQNIAFLKNYRQSIRIESIDPTDGDVLSDERSVGYFGAGNGLRYDWSPRFSFKLNYEFAYRLPRQDEIFGDGLFVLENLEIQPENSHNFNVQWKLTSDEKKITFWEVEGNLFLRQTDNLIFFLVDRVTLLGRFENVFSATSKGIEIGTRISNLLIKGLRISANSTYLDYTNTSDEGLFAGFRGERLPNVPYFFINTRLDFSIDNVFQASDNLNFFWNARYVDSFLLGWENVGRSESKQEVPSQFIQGVGATHKTGINNVQLATSIELSNLTNAKVFDFFGVQRPGRAVFVKLTTQF